MAKSGAPPYLTWVMVGYVAYYITVNVILEVHNCATTKAGLYNVCSISGFYCFFVFHFDDTWLSVIFIHTQFFCDRFHVTSLNTGE